MPLWSLSKPPKYLPNAVATKQGWVDPTTGELVIAIGNLDTRHGGAEITRCRLLNYKPTFSAGEILVFEMNFNEAVDFTLNTADVPFLQIFVGDDPETATELQVPYVSGRGTNTWRFQKTVPLGIGGQVAMLNPASLFIDGELADIDGLGDPVDFEFTPPSPLPTISVVYPQLNAPVFTGITSTYQDENEPAETPGHWVDFTLNFQYPITDIVQTGNRATLLCESNGQQFTANFFAWNDNSIVFTFLLPNNTTLNDVVDIQYLSMDLGDHVIQTVTGNYSDTTYDVSAVPVGNPNVNIAVDPIVVDDVTFNPNPINAAGALQITIQWTENIVSIFDGNPTLQFSVGSVTSATANYVSHTGTQMTFSANIDDTYNTTGGGDPFELIALVCIPGSSINTSRGRILGGIAGQTVDLSYFTVVNQPVIDI